MEISNKIKNDDKAVIIAYENLFQEVKDEIEKNYFSIDDNKVIISGYYNKQYKELEIIKLTVKCERFTASEYAELEEKNKEAEARKKEIENTKYEKEILEKKLAELEQNR